MKATQGGSFEPVELPEPQTAQARCYQVIDLGTQPNVYKGKQDPDKPFSRKLYITWEFPGLLGIFNKEKGEEPFVIGMELTASTGDKSNLSKLVSQWRNKPFSIEEQEGFDPAQMIGKTAFISFIHRRKVKDGKEVPLGTDGKVTNGNTFMKFNGIMPKPKEVPALPGRNPYINWDWDLIAVDGFDKHKETFEKIPKWLQRKLSESQEFKKYAGSYSINKEDEEGDSGSDESESGSKAETKTVKDDW